MSRNLIEVYGGGLVDYADPTPDQFNIEAIAHALSQTCRYGGHCAVFYSVAEHALLVSRLLYKSSSVEYALAGLHHDDAEAYLGDIPTPLKRLFGAEYKLMETKFDAAIGHVVGVSPDDYHTQAVRWADAVALRLEVDALHVSHGTSDAWLPAWEKWSLYEAPTALAPPEWEPGLSPQLAEAGFLAEHKSLIGRHA